MKIWNKWTWAREIIDRWMEAYGWRQKNQELKTKLMNLGTVPQLEEVRELIKSFHYPTHVPRCDECGKQDDEQEVIELGAAIEIGGTSVGDGTNRVNVCLPCVFKAFQMLDSSEIK